MGDSHADNSELDGEKAVEEAVERRLEAIRNDPGARRRYDRDGDGELDDEEWREVRRVVAAEVRTEMSRREDGPDSRGGDDPESDGASDSVLRSRFEIRDELGSGGQGVAYRARDLEGDQPVVVKELNVEEADDWKSVELFEREGKALASLDHPKVPDYVDAFHLESDAGAGRRFFLVQEYVDGRDLEALIDDGFHVDEAEARAFLRELLEILEYLHDLNPPVVHRDIKPSNIMRRSDGAWVLVDFGAVQTVMPDDTGGSTIVGTSGYMPVEQLMGRAVPATDLYAVGATAVHLLSHRHPADLPMEQMRLQFRDVVNVSEAFADFLDKLVAPEVGDRFESAASALRALDALGEDASVPVESGSTSPSGPLQKAPDRREESLSVPSEHEEATERLEAVGADSDGGDDSNSGWVLWIVGFVMAPVFLPFATDVCQDDHPDLETCCKKCGAEVTTESDDLRCTVKKHPPGEPDKLTEQAECAVECMDGDIKWYDNE